MSVFTSTSHQARRSNFELWTWLFMRVSGLLLVFMALAHFAIMHVFTPIEQVNYAFVAVRFSTPFWRIYDLIMLFLGLLHGMNGLRVVADDFIHSGGWRTVATATIYLVTFVFLVIGSQAVLTFQPVAAP